MSTSIVISQCCNSQRSVKQLLCCALLAVLLLSGGPTLPSSSKPRLYTKLDRYFRSLDHSSIDPTHEKTLRSLKATIAGSFSGNNDLVVLFTCPDNAFRGQAAQIILESLVEINHIARLKVFSAGYNNKEIDLRLLKLLIKKGFIVAAPSGGADKMVSWLIGFSHELSVLI